MPDNKIELFDSTLRDGAQGEGISFSADDKIKILRRLDRFGMTYVEAGNPFSNPKDMDFFKQAAKLSLANSKLVAFGATRRKGVKARDDQNVLALLSAGTENVCVFGKSWDLQVDVILNTTLEENLAMIADTVSFLAAAGRRVHFDAEHFFDGYKANPDYALEVLRTAQRAGASVITLCDTNGGCFPDEIKAAVKAARPIVALPLGIHCHNDNGCAVAGTISAVKAGATLVQGTFTGIGERCGNANLSAVIPNLQLKMNCRCVSEDSMRHLTKTARYIAEVTNIKLISSMPYVGRSAFAHKGGMHADGVAKDPRTFEHIDPALVGAQRNFLLSEMSGRSTVLSKLSVVAPELSKNSPETARIVELVKNLERDGFQFEAAGASFELLVLKELGKFKPFFSIEYFHVISAHNYGDTAPERAKASVKIRVGDRSEITADEGEGPVNAIDKALRKALELFYPELGTVKLVDYKVRVIDAGASTAANTRVLLESTDGEYIWTTVGASRDIIDASLKALLDSLELYLYKRKIGI